MSILIFMSAVLGFFVAVLFAIARYSSRSLAGLEDELHKLLAEIDKKHPVERKLLTIDNQQFEITTDSWATDAAYTREEWCAAVGAKETQLGYWDWVFHCQESAADDERSECASEYVSEAEAKETERPDHG